MLRNGDIDGALPANGIDNLAYTYATNTNKLLNVLDNSNNTSGFNDVNKIGDDYTYDANGNMITDKNKNITAITYNHLNLPAKITFATTGNIVYIYNANGQKVKKIVTTTTPSGVVTTDYLTGFQYKDNVLQFFPTAEGYVKNTAGVYGYVFNYTDHLGNVRLSYSDTDKNGIIASSEIVEENNYYPFGLKHKGYNDGLSNTYKYKYNGKELQDELGLNMYDYGARNYDPALGRWMNIDPLAETSRSFSPYTYALNNPLFFIDPDGMEAIGADGFTNDEWLSNNRRNIDRQMGGNGIDIASMTYSTDEERAQNEKEKGRSTVTIGDAEIVNSGLNHAMHQMDGEDGIDPPSKKKGMLENAKEKISEGIEFVKDFSGGVSDFVETYNEMKDANWKNSDKYFHSKANFKASLRGPGGRYVAEKMSNLREITDQRIKGDSRASSVADQRANSYGRQQAQKLPSFHSFTFSYGYVLDQYRPISLPAKY